MEGKLVKTKSTYHLVVNDKIIASMGDSDGKLQKLSLKNCEAIENGYDLDELVEKEFPLLELTSHSSDSYVEEENLQLLGHRKTYIKAFQKALQILGDKKFSEEDIRKAFFHVQNEPTFDVFKKSLQQTEWDVEIELQEVITDVALDIPGFVYKNYFKPRLDKDGCLILKRK